MEAEVGALLTATAKTLGILDMLLALRQALKVHREIALAHPVRCTL